MSVFEASILHHVCIVLLLLWLLSSFNCCHPIAYFISLIYLYLVHERYVMRLERRLRFEERRVGNQRRVLSDSESLRWLNHAVEKIWPVCMEEIVSQKILLPIIPWFLEKYKPWTVKDAAVQQLYMGRSPPIFTEMRVRPQSTGDDHLVLELGLNFRTANDMNALLAVKLRKRLGFGISTKMHLTGMHVEGKVLIGVKFLRHWPYLGRLRVCFMEAPYFQMTVKPIFTHGLDVTEVPGIAGWLDKLLALVFEQTLVEPNMLVVDMEKFVSPQPENWFSVDAKDPVAFAMVEVIEAADIKPSDLNGLADPYVKGQIGPYRFRTKTQKKTLAPKWLEEFRVPICTWESTNVLTIEVQDKDHFIDDTLGECSINIGDLRGGQRHDMWLPLQNIKMGRLHLAITVVEGDKKGTDQPGNTETLNNNKERSFLADEILKEDSLSPGLSEKSTLAADRFEPIDIEGQEQTGVWVHRPGSEVSSTWESRKGNIKLRDVKTCVEGIDCSGSFKSSASGSCNNDRSSSDENQEGSKGKLSSANEGQQDKGKPPKSPNKVVSGLHKFGAMFRRNSKKEDISMLGEEPVSPTANLKPVNTKTVGVNLVLEDSLSVPSPDMLSEPGNTDATESGQNVFSHGTGQHSPTSNREMKEMGKNIFKHAGESVKRVFSHKGSKTLQSDTSSIATERDISLGSDSSDEESLPPSVPTSRVEGIPVVSMKSEKLSDQTTYPPISSENPENKVIVEKIDNDSLRRSEEPEEASTSKSSNPTYPEENLEADK
ncbi:hypothetical protein NMG60_11036867 [Bertholletia excelsa]